MLLPTGLEMGTELPRAEMGHSPASLLWERRVVTVPVSRPLWVSSTEVTRTKCGEPHVQFNPRLSSGLQLHLHHFT